LQVTKILDDLAASGKLKSKDFNKKLVYWALQDRFDANDQPSAKDLDEQLQNLSNECTELRAQVVALETENKHLASEPTDSEIDHQLAALEAKHTSMTSRLDKIRSSAGGVDVTQKAKLEEKYTSAKKEWRSRKRKFKDISDTIEESMDAKKFKSMMDALGIDTDESVGVKVDDDKTTQFKMKR